MEQVIIISLLSGLATGLGGLIVIWFGRPTQKILGFYLGISTGMMGMVVLVDLIPASLQYGNIIYTVIGLSLGITIMFLFDISFKKFFKGNKKSNLTLGENDHNFYKRLGYFMTFAIALHNIPEGLAIGAGFESQVELGTRVALVIALHNVPEGLGVASTLYLGRLPNRLVFLLPLTTGFFIPIGTMISELFAEFIPYWISIGLSLAAGAMGYVVIKDIGPETLRLNRLFGQVGIGIGILILYVVYHLNG